MFKICTHNFAVVQLGHFLWWSRYHICIQVQCTLC